MQLALTRGVRASRRYLIEQTKDAEVIGIVVTALGVGTAWLVMAPLLEQLA